MGMLSYSEPVGQLAGIGFVCLFLDVFVYICHCTDVEVRGHLVEVILSPLCGSQGLSSFLSSPSFRVVMVVVMSAYNMCP